MGSRLKRLSDRIMREGKEVYRTHNVDFEPRWFPVFYLLTKEPSASVTEIASALDVTHPAVSQIVKEMEKYGYIDAEVDSNDGRRRKLKLSEKGQAILPKMESLWADMHKTVRNIMISHSQNLLGAVEEMERSLNEKSLNDRVQELSKNRLIEEVEILEYEPQYADAFKELNLEWIEEYFYVEESDKTILSEPEKYLINTGGAIFFAKLGDEIVGTCGLMNRQNGTYELTKMAVTEKAQGKQAGKKLGLAVIQKTQKLGGQILMLESNRKLGPAINLYKKLGFREANPPYDMSGYERSNIYMEMVITPQTGNGLRT